jgi:hypothetical protein
MGRSGSEYGFCSFGQAAKESILLQITNAYQTIRLETNPDAAFALIIDGKALAYALEADLKDQFLQLAIHCASVICCRVSPKQKALVDLLLSFIVSGPDLFSFLSTFMTSVDLINAIVCCRSQGWSKKVLVKLLWLLVMGLMMWA